MSIERYPNTCMVVHLADSEAHLPDAQAAEAWIGQLDVGIRVHAIEEAQVPCWMAYCDNPACHNPEGDENDTPTHIPAATAQEAEVRLSDLQRQVDGVLLCTACREEAATARAGETWIDRQGDIWRLGDDGLMHSYETAPFAREYVEKKWGPLRPGPMTATTDQP